MSEPSGATTRGGPQEIPRPPGTRVGPPLPWPRLTTVTLADLVRAVAAAPPAEGEPLPRAPLLPPEVEAGQRPAAVLCAAFEEGGQAHVVLTRRSSTMRSHTGQVAFPGGRMEEGETPLEAARREAWEEVGLDPALVTPIGFLPTLTTAINPAPITPVVATLPGRPTLTANPAEVDRVFTTPVVELLADGVYRSEIWSWPDGEERVMHVFELVGDTVWGATARMLGDLLDLIVAAAPG